MNESQKWYVYIIKSSNDKLYTGMTSNLQKRLISHNSGENQYTKNETEWELLYSESCNSSSTARNREKYFKNTAGKEWLKRRGII